VTLGNEVLGALDVGDTLHGEGDGLAAGLDGRGQGGSCSSNNGERSEEHCVGRWNRRAGLLMSVSMSQTGDMERRTRRLYMRSSSAPVRFACCFLLHHGRG
jgi:hypothetical protein